MFEIWKRLGKWFWHYKAANGEIVASGEGYTRRIDCIKAIKIIKNTADSPIREKGKR